MEERKLNEKESLTLISQMIQKTKSDMQVGNGNIFLVYGYCSIAIALTVALLMYLEFHSAWQSLWFLMFVPLTIISTKYNKHNAEVITYIDKSIRDVWKVISAMFVVTIVTFIVLFFVMDTGMGTLKSMFEHFGLILPIALLYISVDTTITGVILQVNALKYLPIIGVILSLLILMDIFMILCMPFMVHIYFAIASIFILILPGHVLNNKSNKQ